MRSGLLRAVAIAIVLLSLSALLRLPGGPVAADPFVANNADGKSVV